MLAAVLPVLRGAQLLCLVSLLGTLTARCVVAPSFDAAGSALLRLARLSLTLAMVTLAVWLIAQTASFADATSLGAAITALPVVVRHTRFGHVLALRLILLAAIWPLLSRGRGAWLCAALLAAAALAAQAALAHAGAIGGSTGMALIATEALHLIAAGAWLGGLIPLLILMHRLPAAQAAVAARRFTPVGLPAVLVLIATALVQGDAFIGGLPGLLGTRYGHIALVKLALFCVLLAIALLNRFVLTARFERAASGRAVLIAAIGIETAIGMAVVMAAAVLASTVPGADAQHDGQADRAAAITPELIHQPIAAATGGSHAHGQ